MYIGSLVQQIKAHHLSSARPQVEATVHRLWPMFICDFFGVRAKKKRLFLKFKQRLIVTYGSHHENDLWDFISIMMECNNKHLFCFSPLFWLHVHVQKLSKLFWQTSGNRTNPSISYLLFQIALDLWYDLMNNTANHAIVSEGNPSFHILARDCHEVFLCVNGSLLWLFFSTAIVWYKMHHETGWWVLLCNKNEVTKPLSSP